VGFTNPLSDTLSDAIQLLMLRGLVEKTKDKTMKLTHRESIAASNEESGLLASFVSAADVKSLE
jgi:hypothetical protein